MVKSCTQFITDKGVLTVAKATKRSEGAIRVWKSRNRFPREAWLELNAAFPELTLQVLKGLARKRAIAEAAASEPERARA